MKKQISKLASAYFIGVLAYFLSAWWLGWVVGPEEMFTTDRCIWTLNAIGLLFWALAYLALQREAE